MTTNTKTMMHHLNHISIIKIIYWMLDNGPNVKEMHRITLHHMALFVAIICGSLLLKQEVWMHKSYDDYNQELEMHMSLTDSIAGFNIYQTRWLHPRCCYISHWWHRVADMSLIPLCLSRLILNGDGNIMSQFKTHYWLNMFLFFVFHAKDRIRISELLL